MTFVFVVSGLAILIASAIAWIVNNISILSSLGGISAPVSSFTMGITGLWFFGREDFRREDRFHLMNLFFSLGLVLYAISEVAASLLANQEGSEAFLFTVSLVQMPGLILWAIGVIGYLRASNSVLKSTNDNRLFTMMVIIPAVAMLTLASLVMVLNPTRNPVEVFTTALLAIGMGVITLAMGNVLLVFRSGKLARPLGLAFLSVLVLTLQIVLWCCIELSPIEPLGQIVRTEAYLMLGTALTSAKSIELF